MKQQPYKRRQNDTIMLGPRLLLIGFFLLPATLVDGFLRKGWHSLRWTATDEQRSHSTCVHVSQLTAGSYVERQKLLLLR